MEHVKLFTLAVIIASVGACSATAPLNDQLTGNGETTAHPAKGPMPTPPKEPETLYRCKISNGEGRIFVGLTDSRFGSENKARHECALFSRNCVLLGCTPESE